MSVFEEHYTVQQLAKQWAVSRMTVAKRVSKYAHLIPDFSKKRRSRYGPIKRHHATWRIPKSVAERMYRDMMGGSVL
jgi:hypothetical protein